MTPILKGGMKSGNIGGGGEEELKLPPISYFNTGNGGQVSGGSSRSPSVEIDMKNEEDDMGMEI